MVEVPNKKIEGRIEFAVQISGELFPDHEALEKLARVVKENDLWDFFMKKLGASEIKNKEAVISFFQNFEQM